MFTSLQIDHNAALPTMKPETIINFVNSPIIWDNTNPRKRQADHSLVKMIFLRVLIRYSWKRGLSTRKAAEEICAAEGEGTIAYAAISKWYKRFDSGDMSLEDKPHSGWPLKLDDGDLQTGLDIVPSSSTRELADELGVGKSTIHRHLKQFDFVHKKLRQDPHKLTEAQ
ncbi:unnamed protein product [Acanthosepion pharaonis]|uniref:Mos1 transposase HTH domain-containing protein n=1 Tax=Acanthosepion pharaonis TaxID=158019 RepID=A0A812BMT7_ACAPH|nr:unnamed protein product [Sepia pharaonis]